jgi:tRNA A58 N-methylase Trm61
VERDNPFTDPNIFLDLKQMNQIQYGDLVVVFEGPSQMNLVKVSSSGQYQNRFGLFYHDDMVGKVYGGKVLLYL